MLINRKSGFLYLCLVLIPIRGPPSPIFSPILRVWEPITCVTVLENGRNVIKLIINYCAGNLPIKKIKIDYNSYSIDSIFGHISVIFRAMAHFQHAPDFETNMTVT